MPPEIKSPFEKYCDDIDKQSYLDPEGEWLDQDHERKAYTIFQEQPFYFAQSLIEDFAHRKKFKGNVLATVEAPQWTGKSLFTGFWVLKSSQIFNTTFNWRNLCYFPEDLEQKLIQAKTGETIWLDEVQKKRVGLGSKTTDLNLQDFEEMGRKTQKNIWWCSPEINNSRHYFFFENYDMERLYNKKCVTCKKADKCFALKKQSKTLCKLPFEKRLGYPTYLTFRLKTMSKFERRPIIRGYVKVPMPPAKFVKDYEGYKDKFIEKLEQQDPDDSFKVMREIADKITKEREPDLFMENSKGQVIPVQSKIVEAVIYEEIGMRRYPKGLIDIIRTIVSNNLNRLQIQNKKRKKGKK